MKSIGPLLSFHRFLLWWQTKCVVRIMMKFFIILSKVWIHIFMWSGFLVGRGRLTWTIKPVCWILYSSKEWYWQNLWKTRISFNCCFGDSVGSCCDYSSYIWGSFRLVDACTSLIRVKKHAYINFSLGVLFWERKTIWKLPSTLPFINVFNHVSVVFSVLLWMCLCWKLSPTKAVTTM